MRNLMTRREALATATSAVATAGSIRAALAKLPPQPAGGVPIIDSHVHLKHGNAERTEYRAETIVRVMDEVGIDKSIVFAMSTTTQRSIEMARQAVKEYPDRLIAYLYALPSYERPVLQEMEAAFAEGTFRGIKIHAGECTLAEYVIDPVLALAGRLGVPCLIDAAGNLRAAERLAKKFPETPILFAHMGRYLTKDANLVDGFIRLAGECEKVWLDLSGVALVEKIQAAAERVGPKKLVWGTDGPHPNPNLVGYARRELDKVMKLDLGRQEKTDILGGNIAQLVGVEIS
jgi:predicted TIM-barrel fold metal-dependent hydrolase